MWTDRSHPYGVHHAHQNGQWNAEGGPSTPVTPPALYVAPAKSQPPGGISEITADAENEVPTAEEGETPVSVMYCSQIPHVSERSSSTSGGRPGLAAPQPRTRRPQVLEEGEIRSHGVQLGAPSNETGESSHLQPGPEK